jgi:hypothetical protein
VEVEGEIELGGAVEAAIEGGVIGACEGAWEGAFGGAYEGGAELDITADCTRTIKVGGKPKLNGQVHLGQPEIPQINFTVDEQKATPKWKPKRRWGVDYGATGKLKQRSIWRYRTEPGVKMGEYGPYFGSRNGVLFSATVYKTPMELFLSLSNQIAHIESGTHLIEPQRSLRWALAHKDMKKDEIEMQIYNINDMKREYLWIQCPWEKYDPASPETDEEITWTLTLMTETEVSFY